MHMHVTTSRLSLGALLLALMTTAFTPAVSPTQQAHYAIDGVFCSGCVGLLESAALEVKGVENVEVDVEKRRVVVTFDADATSANSVLEAITSETTFNLSLIEVTDLKPGEGSTSSTPSCC